MSTTKFGMIPAKSLASAAALLVSLAALSPAFATCSHLTQITNNSGITLRFSEVKSSSSPPFFKSQWTGSRVIPAGATGSIPWTSDLNCTDASGVENHWNVKFIRATGSEHYCGYLAPSQAVTVNTPNLCFPN
jgi:hypothetical protein